MLNFAHGADFSAPLDECVIPTAVWDVFRQGGDHTGEISRGGLVPHDLMTIRENWYRAPFFR